MASDREQSALETWGNRRVLCVPVSALTVPTLEHRLEWAYRTGFGGVELLASGEAWGMHAPSVSPEERFRLRAWTELFARIVLVAPSQSTFDVTLVSPSAAIRRASVSEIWSVFRLAEALGGATVLVRSGIPPAGLNEQRVAENLVECLTTLDRMAGDHNAGIALLNADVLVRPNWPSLFSTVRLPNTGLALDYEAAQSVGGRENIDLLETAGGEKIVYRRVAASRDPDSLPVGGGIVCLSFEDGASPASIATRHAVWEGR